MKNVLIVMLLSALLTGCLHFPIANKTCDLTCYGIEAVENKWCLGIFNYNKCGNLEE